MHACLHACLHTYTHPYLCIGSLLVVILESAYMFSVFTSWVH